MEHPSDTLPTFVPVQTVHGLLTPTEPVTCDPVSKGYFLPTPADEAEQDHSSNKRQKWLNTKLQFSSLMASVQAASLVDSQGFWNGGQEEESMRLDLLDMCLKLQRTLSSPMDILQNIAQAHHLEATLRYAVCNDLARHVPVQGEDSGSEEDDNGNVFITYRELAVRASVDEAQCRRLLRLLITHHIFAEPSPNCVAHTPTSMLLLNPDVQAWIEYSTTDSLLGSTRLTEALRKWPASSHKSETGFSLAHETDLSMFEYFDQSPGKLSRFRKAMVAMARQPGISSRHAISGYPWHKLDDGAMVVDVGGGRGHVASAIVDAYPALKATVQDIGVESSVTEGNMTFSKYDFFQQQPVEGADVYVLRQVLHDWSDEYAERILRNQVAAMSSRSKLVIMEKVMPQPGEWSLLEERRSRTNDVTMMTLFNAKEREMSEWLALTKRADARLHLTHVARPTGSLLSIMEFSLIG